MLDTKFWSDNYISELDPSEKLIFLYFITNPFTTICGIYEITLRQIALDTGFDKEMILKILNRFSDDEKIYYINGWVCVKNFAKHQVLTGSVEIGINKALALVPIEVMAKIKQLSHRGGTEGGQSPKPEPEFESEFESEKEGEPVYLEPPKETFNTKKKMYEKLGIPYKTPKRTDNQKLAWDTETLAHYVKDKAMELHRVEVYINKSESGKGWKALKRAVKEFGLEKGKEISDHYLNSDKFTKFGADIGVMFSEHSINMFLQKDTLNQPKIINL